MGRYFFKFILYLTSFLLLLVASFFVIDIISINNWFEWIMWAMIVFLSVNIVLFLLYRKDDNLLFLKGTLLRQIIKKRKKP